jgi:FlaA1/EpsC-like NDP-sugar epimerase
MNHFKDKRVVVTGAGGSIGSELCRRIIAQRPDALILVSLTEGSLYNSMKQLSRIANGVELVPVLGSVADSRVIESALSGSDIVIHAGAHKHVPLCESNVIEAVNNNVFGTECLLNAVEDSAVQQVVFVSTDKAVRPTSVMGATKRACELLMWSAGFRNPDKDYLIVRFGNVLDSAGSVLPLWREQIAAGGPLTLTDKRCTRYFMSIPEACELITGVAEMRPEGGTFVFDMGEPRSMYQLAQQLIVNAATPCEIVETGLRPGEKLEEELDYGGERVATPNAKVFRIVEPLIKFDHGQYARLKQAVDQGFESRVREALMEFVQ